MQLTTVEREVLRCVRCAVARPAFLLALVALCVVCCAGRWLLRLLSGIQVPEASRTTLEDPARLQRTLNLFAYNSTTLPPPQRMHHHTEGLCRQLLEAMLGFPLPRGRPRWLVNPTTRRPLELDMYNEEHRLAFEYDGAQHDVYTPHFHGSPERFQYRKLIDQLKDQLCADAGVRLIRIPWHQIGSGGRARTAEALSRLLHENHLPHRPLSPSSPLLATGNATGNTDHRGQRASNS